MIRVKLKYKKMVIAISIGTICIGGIAYTFASKDSGKVKNNGTKQEISVTDKNFESGTYKSGSKKLVLEKNAHPEINELVKGYFTARASVDMDKLGTIVSNIANIQEDELKSVAEYVEGYENIDCYTVDSVEKGSYVVLAYTDIKLKGIDATAPGLTGLYVNKDDKGNYVVFNGLLSDELNAFRQTVYDCEGVKDLINHVQDKYQKALENNKELNDFYNKSKEEPEVSKNPETTTKPE